MTKYPYHHSSVGLQTLKTLFSHLISPTTVLLTTETETIGLPRVRATQNSN